MAIFFHFDRMLALPVASNKVADLRRVADECEVHIRSLVELGLLETTFGRVFTPIIMSKLPATVRVELYRAKGPGKWTLDTLRDLLKKEIYARDMSRQTFGQNVGTDSNGGSDDLNSSPWKSSPGTASALTFSAGTKPSGKQSPGSGGSSRNCQFCGGSHFSDRCSKYPDVKTRRAKNGRGCYSCLGGGHIIRDCPNKTPCFHCKNTGHHRSLCPTKFASSGGSSASPGSAEGPEVHHKVTGCVDTQSVPVKGVTASLASHGRRGILQTAITNAVGAGSCASSRALLDTGADSAFITFDLVNRIKPRYLGSEWLAVAGFEHPDRSPKLYRAYEFDVTFRDGRTLPVKAYGTDVIIPGIEKHALSVTKNPILAHVPLAEPLAEFTESIQVDICLGSDYYYEVVKTERIPLKEDGLFLLDSEFGYVVAGALKGKSTKGTRMYLCRGPSASEPSFDLERFWRLEDIGIKDRPEKDDDEIATKVFNDTILFNSSERRYEVKWPLKQPMPDLPSNFKMTLARLKSMLAQIGKKPDVVSKYQANYDAQIDKSVIEVAPEEPDGEVIHYLPHHPVFTPDKVTTKVRIVYDASSKAFRLAPSLNDCVYRGPVMLEDLCGLLMRFRLKRVGVVSDIEKAFLQIGLQKPDRDLVRFLWVRDVAKPVTTDNLIHYRFTRVCFGVIASPWLLQGVLTHHLQKEDTPTAADILANLYVDNVIGCRDSTAECVSYYVESKAIFNKCSMNLREWYSNDSELMAQIPECDRGKQTSTKVLGLTWDLPSDTLACQVGQQRTSPLSTKRSVLKVLAQTFDPCGFFAPVSAPGKWLMQELWQKKYGWDDLLPDDLRERWAPFFADLQRLSECRVPRCYGFIGVSSSGTLFDLHCFCDASAKAYCAVVYLKPPGTATASLVFAKCRVSPLKIQTIPRLELLAATVGSRLLEYVAKELRIKVGQRFLWSDSKCVLYWILGKPVSTVFVKNRVAEIKALPNVQFRYVPTADNPADLPTRGVSFDGFGENSLWWHGPHWLADQANWPESIDITGSASDGTVSCVADEMVKATGATVGVGAVVPIEPPGDSYLIDPARVSSLSKLLRVTAWLKRFVDNARKVTNRHDEHLTAAELRAARVIWERNVQRYHYPDVVSSGGKNMGPLKKLGSVFVDADGIIRCSTRLEHADVPNSVKCPKLLPKCDPYTQLVIQSFHEQLLHAGVKQTLAELRYEYWVVQGRSQVKKVISRCLKCKRQKGGPFAIPPAPALPEFRVKTRRPFSCVGLDYLGPLMIRKPDGGSQKVWICLFTCAVTRAIHLEVVQSQNSDHFLKCFRRFMTVYGTPTLVVSDNASQFVTSRSVLDELWQDVCQSKTVQDYAAGKGIDWKFITEAAPWMGGFYERLVACVKTSLKSAICRQRLDLDELQTVVCEVATVVNLRPLLYSEDEVGDFPLTPAHLIMRHPSVFSLVPGEDDDEAHPGSIKKQLILSWKRIQHLLGSFWDVWRKSYLVGLQEHHRVLKQRNVSNVLPRVGEVVLIADDHLPRSQWRIGRVVELIYSDDNLCRSVKLLIPGGRYMNRPIKLLYPLEISDPTVELGGTTGPIDVGSAAATDSDVASDSATPQIDAGNVVTSDDVGPGNDQAPPVNGVAPSVPSARPKRGAAKRALRQIKTQLDGANDDDLSDDAE